MRKLKKLLFLLPTLKKIDNELRRPMVLTIDASPIDIRWAIGQDDYDKNKYVVGFGAKILNACKWTRGKNKLELWRVITVIKNEKKYLIGATMIVEMDCLPRLSIIAS